jgi:RNA polymerase sigma-70 factor (ECF subfamily)
MTRMTSSRAAFRKIYDDFQPKILRYMVRLVGEDEAEDLTQEVLVRASQALLNFRGESTLSTWLYRIATNAAMDRLRSRPFRQAAQERRLDDSSNDSLAAVGDRDFWTGQQTPSLEQQVVRQEMNECIWRFVEQLPEDYRVVVVLSEWEELKNAEIAEILGITLDTVKIRLHRARARLKEEFETHCEVYWVEELECDLKRIGKGNRGADQGCILSG